MHAISEFLRKPLPMIENIQNRFDIGPVLDFCSQLDTISIMGGNGTYRESNIVLNKLPFELSCFKVTCFLIFGNYASISKVKLQLL